MLTVTTFLWSDPDRRRSYTFTPDHVVILKNMVARNLSIPHDFVCVTDTPFRADGIRCVPLDWSKHVPGTCFVRLMLRHPNIGGLLGRRILNLDLDCVIVGDLTPLIPRDTAEVLFVDGEEVAPDSLKPGGVLWGTPHSRIDRIFSPPPEAVFWLNPNYEEGGRRAFYQTSVQYLEAGAHSELWEDFDPKYTPTWINRRFGGAEQAWVSERLPWDLPHWTQADGVYGAGRMFRDNEDKGLSGELPANARIVFFPGDRMPEQPDMVERFPWIKEHYR